MNNPIIFKCKDCNTICNQYKTLNSINIECPQCLKIKEFKNNIDTITIKLNKRDM